MATTSDGVGLTPLEAKLALIDPGFSGSAITSRMDGFVYGEEIKFVEYNAENPSSLSDQEGLNHLLFDLPADVNFCRALSFAAVLTSGKITRNFDRHLPGMGRRLIYRTLPFSIGKICPPQTNSCCCEIIFSAKA